MLDDTLIRMDSEYIQMVEYTNRFIIDGKLNDWRKNDGQK